MRKLTHIMIHHSATEDTGTVSWTAIERFHKETQKWNDIGYHFGIELVINPFTHHWLVPYQYQALLGRPIEQEAAACYHQGMNKKAIHICCVGNFDIEIPSDALLQRLYDRLVGPLSKRYKISPENWIGHRDAYPHKTCPGTNFDLNKIRKLHKE